MQDRHTNMRRLQGLLNELQQKETRCHTAQRNKYRRQREALQYMLNELRWGTQQETTA